MLTLQIEKRAKTDSVEALRKAGKIPAVFYGPKEASTPVTVAAPEFIKVFKKAGESSVIELAGVGETHQAVIKDVSEDAVSGQILHADFYVIEKGKKLELSIPLIFTGVAPAVKELGGILVKVVHQLKVKALPKDFPQNLTVDISSLATFESSIHASAITLPAGVELVEKADEVIAAIAKPVEEVEEAPAAIDLESIEVEKKGKKEEEGAEGEKAPAAAKPEAKK